MRIQDVHSIISSLLGLLRFLLISFTLFWLYIVITHPDNGDYQVSGLMEGSFEDTKITYHHGGKGAPTPRYHLKLDGKWYRLYTGSRRASPPKRPYPWEKIRYKVINGDGVCHVERMSPLDLLYYDRLRKDPDTTVDLDLYLEWVQNDPELAKTIRKNSRLHLPPPHYQVLFSCENFFKARDKTLALNQKILAGLFIALLATQGLIRSRKNKLS